MWLATLIGTRLVVSSDKRQSNYRKEAMKIVYKHKHADNCYAVKEVNAGTWDTTWGVVTMEFANRFGNQTPKRSGYVAWLVAHCNCGHCKAETWILLDDFLKLIPKQ